MFIYIDESGNFIIPPDGRSRVCCVAALVIPESVQEMVFADFRRLIARWGVVGEVKGSKLAEAQVADVIQCLSAYEVVAKITGIDMGQHTADGVVAHQRGQAAKIVKNLTPEHHPEAVREMYEFKDRVAAFPQQLYVQSTVATNLVYDVIQAVVIYYAMKKPKELGAFHWIIDGKDTVRTQLEELWETLVPAYLASNFGLSMVRGADYSHFERFMEHTPEPPYHIRMSGRKTEGPVDGPDLRKVFRESLRYGQSKDSLGLQLVDVVASAYQRAMNDRLQRTGWEKLGRLFVTNEAGKHTVPYLVLESSDMDRDQADHIRQARKRHYDVLLQLDSLARPIV